jgi:AraC-like DNA-binding protein
MKLDFYKPIAPILQAYIHGYYFISEGNDTDLLNYWTFPNNYTILSTHQFAATTISGNKIVVDRTSNSSGITTDLVIRYTKPIEIIYKTAINEITIYFKPLGLHQFIDSKIPFLHENHHGTFRPFHDFEETMYRIFAIPDRQKQIEALENYWISKFRLKEIPFIEKILIDIEAGLKVEHIAEKLSLSRQYISKLFKEHVGKPISEYKKIHQFRNTFAAHKKIKTLTELSYANSYYDQSHFIKHFKELTHIKPTAFFAKVDTDRDNVWLYI